MTRLGTKRSRQAYVECSDLADVGSLTVGTILSGLSILGVSLKSLTPLAASLYGVLKGKTVSKYKVKVSWTETFVKKRVFDTDQWVTVSMWEPSNFRHKLIRK